MTEYWLVSDHPGHPARFRLQPPGPIRLGRSPECEVRLDGDRTVSRQHAELGWVAAAGTRPGQWRLANRAATSPATVNGAPVGDGIGLTLAEGDILGIGGWRLRLVGGATGVRTAPMEDAGAPQIERMPHGGPVSLAQRHLLILLAESEAIHRATTAAGVQDALVSAASRATGLENAALVRPLDDGSVEVLASVGRTQARFSRTMLRDARTAPVIVTDSRETAGSAMGESLQRMAARQAICVPMGLDGTASAFLCLDGAGTPDRADLVSGAGVAGALARMAAQALGNLERSAMERRFAVEQQQLYAGTVLALINAIDAKDPYTRGHSDRVATFARLLAEAAGLPEDMVRRAYLCGVVHDLGKIGVPEAVLCKPGKLTDDEFALIKAHPEIGHRILRDIPQLDEVLPGVLEHHEKWDGSGYPGRLAGEAISLLGRVVCIADCFDAMTSARVYRPGRPVEEVLAEIARCAGTHFDPALAKAFVAIAPESLMPHVAVTEP